MNNSTNGTNVIVGANELAFLEWDSNLTELDIENLIVNKELIGKFINHAIRNIRYSMINLQFESKEKVTTEINTLINLREGIEKTVIGFKEYKKEIEAAKNVVEEVDTRSQEQIEWEKKIADIKSLYKI